ncbi:MAG TPA: amidohydrolase family protein [Stellaceae bacterium]|jgi:predicted TIM-barrel fold metal-dependent hydrolase
MAKPYRIDVHHHPTPVLELMGGRVSGSPGIKSWMAAVSLEDMDKNGVATAILSMPNRAAVWRAGDQARNRAMARQWNEFMTRQATDHPGRFGVFAAVPIFDIEGSLREAEYALDVLKADGITLMTNMGDKWLGDPHYFPLFEELHRRKAVVYTHPISADCMQNMLPDVDDSVIEFTADTSRAIARLLFSGAAHRFKDIGFIFSHAGGTMPFILERFTRHALSDKTLAERVPDGVIAYLQRFYYDTAQASHPSAMASITEFVAITQFLFGTDFPFRNAADHVSGLNACGFSEAELDAIECGNAQRLLPRWR